MKNNNSTSFIIITGILIVIVFTIVATYNILPNRNESNSYYVKVEDEMSAKIESLDIRDNKLSIETSGDAFEYCVKSTISTPDDKSLCWKKINDNKATISIFDYKKYYIWIKDNKGNISSPLSINKKEQEKR